MKRWRAVCVPLLSHFCAISLATAARADLVIDPGPTAALSLVWPLVLMGALVGVTTWLLNKFKKK